MRSVAGVLCVVLALGSLSAVAQWRRDPLTLEEVDKMRDTADKPKKRLELMVEFAQARLLEVEHLRSDPRLALGRGEKIHDLLRDFALIVDSLDSNLDMYADRQEDLRKPLPRVIQAGREWQAKLRTLKEAAAQTEEGKEEYRDYEFVLEDAIDAVNANMDNARSLLDEQRERDSKKD